VKACGLQDRPATRMGAVCTAALFALFGLLASEVSASEQAACTDRLAERRPYFGDTHVHTAFSFDAWGQGTLAGPRDAYRYARGEPIGIQPYDANGDAQASVQLRRPLDFAVVTDHSDLLGETQMCQNPSLPGHDSLVCRVVRRFPALGYALVNGHVYSNENPERYSFCGENGALCLDAARGPWREIQDAAEAFDDHSAECAFTTFVGYEWTGMPGGSNIHRNVIFESEVAQDFPTTYIETPTAEGLWSALERECLEGKPGCDVLAIPHNSNVSNGLMWPLAGSDGAPLDAALAARRARLEPLVEVTQHKGDSECRAGAADELCGFETLAYARMQDMTRPNGEPIPPRSYVRETLTEGLRQQAKLGVNPFKFGLIGSTDTHFGTPGMVDEDDYKGHAAGTVSARFGVPPYPDRPDFTSGGLAVLYAEENSRGALFQAMKRREAYGTSGPRIVARFFGGWGYAEDMCRTAGFASAGYAGGVPMGSDLPVRPEGASAPTFALSALRDPGDHGVASTALQRMQIIKSWEKNGETLERVHEVAGSPNNRARVDLDTCQPEGEGFGSLCTVWRDPDFDPEAHAAYYARIVENPSCRWTGWTCMRAGVDCDAGNVPDGLAQCCDTSIPKTLQERAWTSPIWYTPPARASAAAAPQ
jgi:hypothetical protein